MAAPFQFALTAGPHTIRLDAVREPIALGSITVRSPVVVPTYEQRLAEWKAQGYKEVTGNKQIKIQAEEILAKSDPTVRDEVDFDALAEPNADGLFRLNSFGWQRWRLPGQWARWKITVPEDGLYEISFDSWQGFSGKRPRLRSLRVDGATPFREMQSILFRSDRNWHLETMRPEQLPNQKPYLFYLSKGDHVLQLTVTLGFMAETMRALDQSLGEMSELSREMLMINRRERDGRRGRLYPLPVPKWRRLLPLRPGRRLPLRA